MKPVAALLAALVLVLSACGGDDGGGGDGGGATDPAALLAAAIGQADDQEAFETKLVMESDFEGQRISMSGRMISNADSTRGRGTMTLEEPGEEPFEFEMILLDGSSYTRSAALDGALPDGKTWIRSQDEELSQQSLTPQQFIDLLRDTPDVREVGREPIRGRETVHLRGPFDMEEAADRLGSGPLADMVEQQPGMVDRLDATIDVWIETETERLRRVAMDMTVEGEPGSMQMTGDIIRDDVSLNSVKAPPQDEVVDEKDVPGMG